MRPADTARLLALAGWFAITGFDPERRRHMKFYTTVLVTRD